MVDLVELTKKFETIDYMDRTSNVRIKNSGVYIEKGYLPVVLSLFDTSNSRLNVLASILQSVTGCYIMYNTTLEKGMYEEKLGILMKEKEIDCVISLQSELFYQLGQVELTMSSDERNQIKKIIQMNRLPVREKESLEVSLHYITDIVQKQAIGLTVDEASLYAEKETFSKLVFSLVQIIQYIQEIKE